MIEREYYRLSELAAKWGCTADDLLHLADTGRLQLAVAFAVPDGLPRLMVEVVDLLNPSPSGFERLPFDMLPISHRHLLHLKREDAITLARTGEVRPLSFYTQDGSMLLFEWPPGTGFRVTRENVVVLSRDGEDLPLLRTEKLKDMLELFRAGGNASAEALIDALFADKKEAAARLERWEAVVAPTPGELLLQETEVRQTRARLASLDKQIKAMRGDMSDDECGQQHEPEPVAKPLQRQAAQDATILAKLAELGFNAQALPVPPAGKESAAKSAIRKALPPSYTKEVVKKAWQRLLKAGAITYARTLGR